MMCTHVDFPALTIFTGSFIYSPLRTRWERDQSPSNTLLKYSQQSSVSRAWLGQSASTTHLVSDMNEICGRLLLTLLPTAGILSLTFPAMVDAMTQVGACKSMPLYFIRL